MNDKEIKRQLAGRAAEYMMFNDDEEDTEVPSFNIYSVSIFLQITN